MANPPNKNRPPRLLSVGDVWHLTPNMIRVTLVGPDIHDMAAGCEGAHCKIFLPSEGQSYQSFSDQLRDGPRPIVRTYTVRHIRPEHGEMDIDFVDHGDAGPASAWARKAQVGDFCGFAGPGSVKLSSFYADSYLVVADMSALPVAAATLEAMPRDATGAAIFEITSQEDKQKIDAPEGIKQHWVINNNPHSGSAEIAEMARAMTPPDGVIQTCIAGESSLIKELRNYLTNERQLPKADAYISGYWKMGLIEDEHQQMKRAEAVS
ncbi:MAG: siderophore-interacting protein [Litoreibacter sp.]